MKKLLLLLLLIGLASARPSIGENLTEGKSYHGYEYISLEVLGEVVATSSNIVWYAYDIAGMSSIGIEDLDPSAGNSTTINAIPLYRNGKEMSGESAVITEGTALTAIKSASYKFMYYNWNGAPTTVTFNFIIAD